MHDVIPPLSARKNHPLAVSPIGLGTVKFGRNQAIKYPQSFDLPTDREITELLAMAKDLGINHVDTAPAYGNSEQRLGKLLQDRTRWIISSKTGEIFTQNTSASACSQYNFTPEFTIHSVQRSLHALRTDYIDIIFVHSDGSDAAIIQQYGTLDALASLKQQGLIRAYGLSVKDPIAAVASLPQCDCLMLEYHPGMPAVQQQQTEHLLQQAITCNSLVFVKKALMSGNLHQIPAQTASTKTNTTSTNPVQASFQFVFSHPAVHSITIGTLNKKHLQDNVAALHQAIAAIQYAQVL